MAQSVTLLLPEETLQRYRRGATAARKLLEEFLVERLLETVPPLADDLSSPLREELQVLERLDDDALWQVARGQLPPARQRLYSRLLARQSQGIITAQEQETLHSLGEQARLLTLKAAHAYMVLKWRGHRIPSPEELQRSEWREGVSPGLCASAWRPGTP
jgi:hypothetical protein